MYYLAQILIVLILFSIQTTWLGMFSIGGVVPDLALIWVVYCAVHCSRTIGVGSGLLILSSLFDGLVFYLSMNTVLGGEAATSFLYQSLPAYSLYNGIVGPVLFFALNRLEGWLKLKTSNFYMTWVK